MHGIAGQSKGDAPCMHSPKALSEYFGLRGLKIRSMIENSPSLKYPGVDSIPIELDTFRQGVSSLIIYLKPIDHAMQSVLI